MRNKTEIRTAAQPPTLGTRIKEVLSWCPKLIALGITMALIFSPLLLGQETPASPKLVVIYLGRGGCQPAQVQVKAGTIGIHMINASHKPNLSMSFHSGAGLAIGGKTISPTDAKWTQVVTLTPGTYVLEAVGEPELKCSVVVE
jgi:hypothetical protein